MKELEQQFGLPLFQRLPHGMALTDAGRALLGHARSVAHSVARMQDDAQSFRDGADPYWQTPVSIRYWCEA